MARDRNHEHDLGILGLPGDVNPWDIRFDPTRRRHLDALGAGRFRFTVWAEPELTEAWLVVRRRDRSVKAHAMEVSGFGERFAFYRRELEVDQSIEYSFAFRTATGRPVYLVPSGISGSVERLDRFRLDPDDHLAAGVPDWAKGAVIYQIFPDRFANGDPSTDPVDVLPWTAKANSRSFHGGDLVGIERGLPYLADLGVDAIYLNPIFTSPSNHRYDTVDYFQVDPMLGGNEALASLVDAAHRRSIRVILDASFNHVHPRFFAFADLVRRGKRSEYRDWFTVDEWPIKVRVRPRRGHWSKAWIPVWQEQTGIEVETVDTPGPPVETTYEAWYGVPTMPRVDLSNPDARNFMLSVARHWIDEYGIDGWRMDVARYVDPDFWNAFRETVKQANPDAYLVAEIFGDVGDWLQGDRFDATMNYTFRSLCLSFFARGEVDGQVFLERATALAHMYGQETTLVNHNLIGSHDTPRFLTEAGGDVWRLRLATLFQLTYPGAPGLYYGDEIGMVGGDDPDCRDPFPAAPPASHPVSELIREVTRLRRTYRALREGEFVGVAAKADAVVFARGNGRSRILVAINAGSRPVYFDVPFSVVAWGDATPAPGGASIPPRSAAILR